MFRFLFQKINFEATTRDSLLFFCVLMLGGMLIFIPSIHGHDGILNYSYLRSMIFDGDLDFDNDYEHFDKITENAYDLSSKPRHPDTNLPMNYYGVGSSLLWSPFYLLGHGVKQLVAGLTGNSAYGIGDDYPGDEISSRWFISLGSVFWASLGLTLLFNLGRKFYSTGTTLFACGLILFASPLCFYMYFHPSMSHACSFFAVSFLVYCYFNNDRNGLSKRSYLHWVGVGIACGLVMMTRYQDALLLLVPATCELAFLFYKPSEKTLQGWKGFKCWLPFYAASIVALLLTFLPQLAAWKALHGAAFSGPSHYLKIGALDLTKPVHFIEIFFSSQHGLFFWHPLLLFGIIGLCLKSKIKNAWLPGLWLGLIAHSWIIACWDIWWGGASFGHRMFISVLPLFFIGTLSLYHYEWKFKYTRKLLWVVLILGVFWNGGLLVQYGAGMIDREGKVSFKAICRNQFVDVPKFLWTKSGRLLMKKPSE